MNDVLLNKKESIERCITQIREYYAKDTGKDFQEDYFKQDAIAINLQRAAELTIDMANHVIRRKKLGLVKESRESIELLKKSEIITPETAENIKKMISFRNILVHEYQDLSIEIMENVITNHLQDLLDFTNQVLFAE